MAISLLYLAQLLFVAQGEQAAVRSRLEESLALFTDLGGKEGIANAYMLAGQLSLAQGELAAARVQTEESLRLYREMGHRRAQGESLALLARVRVAQGEQAAALPLYQESLAIGRELKHAPLSATCLEGLAQVVWMQGQSWWAAVLLGAAEALRESIDVPIARVEQEPYARTVAAVRSDLGEEDFTRARSQGRTLSPEQAAQQAQEQPLPRPAAAAAPTPPAYPAGLTARQVQVLQLLARGMTNGEIAGALGLSEKTVAHHLTHIFNKTGSENRAAAVAFAIHHGLG